MVIKMPELDLEAIKKRVNAATPGFWQHSKSGSINYGYVFVEDIEEIYESRICASVDVFDGEFIAHARTDIPALIQEVERLRNEISQLENKYHKDHMVSPWLEFGSRLFWGN